MMKRLFLIVALVAATVAITLPLFGAKTGVDYTNDINNATINLGIHTLTAGYYNITWQGNRYTNTSLFEVQLYPLNDNSLCVSVKVAKASSFCVVKTNDGSTALYTEGSPWFALTNTLQVTNTLIIPYKVFTGRTDSGDIDVWVPGNQAVKAGFKIR